MQTWTKEYARKYLVHYHNINTSMEMTIDDVFNRIHFIQYDPLNVVGTNSELVLQSRIKGFKKVDLENALYKERKLIDGWDKQMGIYQSRYFPEYEMVREARAEGSLRTFKNYLKIDPLEYQKHVLDIIKSKGPVLSSEIKFGESTDSKWFSTKPSSASLDYLFHQGVIGVSSRKNTQKRYDLNTNLIPNHMSECPFGNIEDFTVWYLLRRIKACGLMSNKSGIHNSGIQIKNKVNRTKYLKILLDKGLIEEIKVEGLNEELYVASDSLEQPIELKDKISFIAPLDNLIWDRDLISKLFNFDYRWEVYTPKDKRKFGYYVLPILQESRFIGRIEFDKQRNKEPLKVKNLYLEPGIRKTKKLEKKLNQALKRFAKYLGTTYHTIEV